MDYISVNYFCILLKTFSQEDILNKYTFCFPFHSFLFQTVLNQTLFHFIHFFSIQKIIFYAYVAQI